jgi:putative tryptophan/tyrosine transport system substrate-binding protein
MSFDQLKRRDFIAGLGASAAWPVTVAAQQPTMPIIGVLNTQTPGPYTVQMAAFHRGLREGGYVEGANLAVEYRWAEGHDERLPALAADLVYRNVKVIAGVNSTAAVLAAMAATTTIPIIFNIGADPVKNRLVASFNRPGANVTGVSTMTNELGPKRLGLLRDLLPNASVVVALINPSNPNAESDAKDLQAAAHSMGLTVNAIPARDEREIDAFFTALVRQRAAAFLTTSDTLFNARHEQIVVLAAYHKIPAVYDVRSYTDAGGLISYAPRIPDMWREAGLYVSRVLMGEKPADLPIIQPTKFQLVINLKAAKALSLDIPPKLLALADEVIE